MALAQTQMETWERAEIARSSVEASLTSDAALKSSARTIRRYERPSGSTPYPLEYCSHRLGDVQGRRIVDFGCGLGAHSLLLANRGAHVPFVAAGQLLPWVRRRIERVYRIDAWVLRRLPWMVHFAGIRVLEVIK